MLIGQISDSHMLPPGETNHAGIDPAARLKAAVDAMNHANPDLVLHTGDIAHHGTPEAYALTKEILEKLEAPIYLIPGNHDDRASMRSVFSSENWMPDKKTPSAFIHYEIDADPLHIIMLDSLLPGQVGGQLCDDRLEFLAKQLDHDTRPTIIAIHHPPMAPGLGGFAKIGLEGADKLAEIVSRRQQVIRIIAGHNHRSVMGVCGGVPAVVAPSCAFPFAFNTNKDASISIAFEPPGAALHIWEKGEGLVSHTISIGDWPPPRALR